MTAAYFLTTLGLVPYFASRALLPLFMTALMLRLGAEWSFLAPVVGFAPAADLPPWATSNVALVSLGLGAGVEGLLNREPALREKLALTDAQIKALLALLLCLILAPQSQSESALATHHAPRWAVSGTLAWLGASKGYYVWSALVAGLVGLLSYNRNRLYAWLTDADEDDDFGLQRVLAWLEEALGVLGVITVFVVPVLALAAAVGALACSVLITRRVQRLQAAAKVPCVVCAAPLEACAPHCPQCRSVQPSPRAVGLLGRVQATPAGRNHTLSLKLHKRCTYCGSRVHGAGVDLVCSHCSTPVFSSQQAVEAYLQSVSRDVPPTLVVMAAFGAVPVFGLFAGVLYFRLTLLVAVRQYTPTASRVFGRWLLRFVNAGLLLLQPVPVLGMVTLPLTALSSTWFYTKQLKRAAARLKPLDYSETLRR
jgi:hypothetical protein